MSVCTLTPHAVLARTPGITGNIGHSDKKRNILAYVTVMIRGRHGFRHGLIQRVYRRHGAQPLSSHLSARLSCVLALVLGMFLLLGWSDLWESQTHLILSTGISERKGSFSY